jgi:choline-sulfatase
VVSSHSFLSQRQVTIGKDVSLRDVRRATAAYYGMVECIDEQYQQVLDALIHAGQNLDNWIIVYCSDHGEMLGEHGIWEKQKFYEGSVRVPLIIRYPKINNGGKVVSSNVNLCDLFTTLCELAGIPTPDGLDSRSLVPLLNDDSNDWDNETISQFGDMNLMIKRDQLKYQYYGKSSISGDKNQLATEVLFDLERDPGELINFIDDPKYAGDINAFRKRRAKLNHGPDANPDYINAGYQE